MRNPSQVIRVNQLQKVVKAHDGELIILHDISFAIEAGESVAIVGSSGSVTSGEGAPTQVGRSEARTATV